MTGPPFVNFYAGAALKVNGKKVGSLCIIDQKPREMFSLADKQTLLELGLVLTNLILNRYEEFKHSRQHKSQCLLSLTHNLNTMVTGMELPLRALEATGAYQKEASLLDSSLERLKRTTSALLGLAAQLPSVNDEGNDPTQSITFAGSQTSISDLMVNLKLVVALSYPSVDLNVPELEKGSAQFFSFVDVFIASALKTLKNITEASCPCKGRVYFVDSLGNEVSFESLFSLRELVIEIEARAQGLGKQVGLLDPGDIAKVVTLPGRVLNQYDPITFSSKTIIGVPCWKMLPSKSLRQPISARDKRLNILVVDDDRMSINQLSPSLLARACEVTVAHNGREGMETLVKFNNMGKPFHAVFVDLLMPLVNGIDLLEKIATNLHFRQLFCIAMHGVEEQLPQLMSDMNNDLSKYGINRILLKPIDDSIIIQLIDSIRTKSA